VGDSLKRKNSPARKGEAPNHRSPPQGAASPVLSGLLRSSKRGGDFQGRYANTHQGGRERPSSLSRRHPKSPVSLRKRFPCEERLYANFFSEKEMKNSGGSQIGRGIFNCKEKETRHACL